MNKLIVEQNTPVTLIGGGELGEADLDLALSLASCLVAAVSVFPLRRVQARSTGLEWKLDGLTMQPGGQIGTSNRALGPVEIWVDQPGLLALVPRHHLAAVMQALLAAPQG